ncbi:MAG: hypothetical protein JJE28_08930 [Actinomycetales bacterium]|nr:hypothetical protein [Actinomycetales bacterium]
MSTEDEEALAWAGDNDERLTTGSTSQSPVRKRRASPLSSPDVSVQQPVEESGENDAPGGLSSREGIMLGVLGGFYLLFTAAWIVTALRNPVQIADPLGSFMFIMGLWMAALAPAAWFSAALVFGRRRSFLWRFAMLALGAVLVIPWPYFSWAS